MDTVENGRHQVSRMPWCFNTLNSAVFTHDELERMKVWAHLLEPPIGGLSFSRKAVEWSTQSWPVRFFAGSTFPAEREVLTPLQWLGYNKRATRPQHVAADCVDGLEQDYLSRHANTNRSIQYSWLGEGSFGFEGRHIPIDLFLEALAMSQKEQDKVKQDVRVYAESSSDD